MAQNKMTAANLMQTASNVSATLVAAATTAGLITTLEAMAEEFASTRDSAFETLQGVAEIEAAGGSIPDDPAEFVVTFGKHKGKTLAQIQDDDPSYFTWICNKCENKVAAAQARKLRDRDPADEAEEIGV